MSRILILKEAPYGSREESPQMTELMNGNYAGKPEACTICGGSPVVAGARYRNPLGNVDFTHHVCEPCADQYDIMHSSDKYKGEPMDIAMRLLKNDDERRKIEEFFENSKWATDADEGARDYYFSMGWPLTPFNKMSDRQIKLYSHMIFNYGTDGKPNVPAYWREPFEAAGHDYSSEILMGDGMEHIPDDAYNELIRYHQLFNDAVEALPGGPNPQKHLDPENHENHMDIMSLEKPGDITSGGFEHPHETAQRQMKEEYPHWGTYDEEFQEHYGIDHDNRQFTPQEDNSNWQDSIETGEPMDIAMRLLKMPFHGTTEDAIEGGRFFGGIKRRGLQPKSPGDGHAKNVFFTDNPIDAAYYAKRGANQQNSRPVLIEFPESDVPTGSQQSPWYAGNYRTTNQTIPSTNFQYHYGPQREEGMTDKEHEMQTDKWLLNTQKLEQPQVQQPQVQQPQVQQPQVQQPQVQQPQMIQQGEPMDIAMRLLKERVSPEAKRHKLEYDKKYESSPERVKYREELNRERRRRHIMGQGGPDMSHTSQHTIVPEDPHTNRARHFKDKGTLL